MNIKNLAVVQILLISFVFSDSQDTCSKYEDEESCSKYSSCKWNVNSSETVCSNKDLGCQSKSSKQDCQNAPDICQYQPAFEGGCSPDKSVNCTQLSYLECRYQGKRCLWNNDSLQCIRFTSGFNCESKNQNQCLNAGQYCQASFRCQGTSDNSLCSFKEKGDCQISVGCEYKTESFEKCIDKSTYCSMLSGEDCSSDQQFCKFNQTSIASCTNKPQESICGNKSLDDCDKIKQFCERYIIPYSCSNKVSQEICKQSTDQSTCSKLPGCHWQDGICIIIFDCSKLDQTACEQSTNTQNCNSTRSKEICRNKSDFGCSAYNNSKSRCLLYPDYCQYSPMLGQCTPINSCALLTSTQCQTTSNKCIYEPEKGSCSLKNTLTCISDNDKTCICKGTDSKTCITNDFCVYQFLGCSDIEKLKPEEECSLKTQDQCKQSGSYCQASNLGNCVDNTSLNCKIFNSKECSNQEGCIFYPSAQEACLNKVDCKKISEIDCQKQSKYCNYTPLNGSCISQTTIDQTEHGIRLLFCKIYIIIYIILISLKQYI